MRFRTLTTAQKSVLAGLSIAAAIAAVAVPATAAAAAQQRTIASTVTSVQAAPMSELPRTRTVDVNAEYFTNIARSAVASATGKVATPQLDVQIALLEQSKTMDADDVRTLTTELRSMTAATADQVVAFDAEQARKAAEAKAEAERVAAQKAQEEADRAAREQAAAQQGFSGDLGSGDNSPGAARALAQSLMASNYGWGGDQFSCLDSLWNRESGWNYQAANPSSGAYGIPQALPGSKMGAGWQNSAAVQVAWGLGYIADRYGTPCGAWGHSESTGWY